MPVVDFEDVLKLVADYRPRMSPQEWETIRPVVTEALRKLTFTSSVGTTQAYISIVAGFVRWAHYIAGKPLDAAMFDYRTVGRYVAVVDLADSTRSSHRALLLRIADETVPPGARRFATTAYPGANVERPYTPREVAVLRTWPGAQTTGYRRRSAQTLVSLALGAGLRPLELANVRAGDVTEGERGLTVTVWGAHGRTVPVIFGLTDMLREAVDGLHRDAHPFRQHREVIKKSLVSAFVSDADPVGVPVTATRMRTTFTLSLLEAGVPLHVVRAVIGVDHYTAIARIAPFLPEPTSADVLNAVWDAERAAVTKKPSGGCLDAALDRESPFL